MQDDNTPAPREKLLPGQPKPPTRPEGLCPKCQGESSCRREMTESGPVWYCVNFDVRVSE